MRNLSSALLTAVAILGSAVEATPAPKAMLQPSPRVIVLFGANWCAPCMKEMRQLNGLVVAAAPDELMLAWIDSPPNAPIHVRVMRPEQAQSLAYQIGGEGFGLPFSAIFDGQGNLCGVWNGPLSPNDIPTLRARCDN